jgi:hypothetical protein
MEDEAPMLVAAALRRGQYGNVPRLGLFPAVSGVRPARDKRKDSAARRWRRSSLTSHGGLFVGPRDVTLSVPCTQRSAVGYETLRGRQAKRFLFAARLKQGPVTSSRDRASAAMQTVGPAQHRDGGR